LPEQRTLGWLLGLVLLTSTLPAQGSTDHLESPSSRRIIAISDIHGAFDNLRAILKTAHLINDHNRWIGGDSIFVQTGDFLDRGPQTRQVAELLMDLQKQAPLQGGEVIVLLGNHEVLNMIGDTRYVADLETFVDARSEDRRTAHCNSWAKRARSTAIAQSLKAPKHRELLGRCQAVTPLGFVEYSEELGPEGDIGRWLRSLPAVVEFNDIVFLHGGIGPALAGRSLEDINGAVREELAIFDRIRAQLVKRGVLPSTARMQTIIAGANHLAAMGRRLPKDVREDLRRMENFKNWFLVNPEGPLWFRGYAHWSEEEGAEQLPRILAPLGASHVVVGHTPQKQLTILGRFDNRVFLIDTGMLTSHYKGRASALEIRDGRFSAIYVDGTASLDDTARH
jgi:hypothetical protein